MAYEIEFTFFPSILLQRTLDARSHGHVAGQTDADSAASATAGAAGLA
jgi:hypothetical protein